jgi:hypothetical protein
MPGLLLVDIEFLLWAGNCIAANGLLGVFIRHFEVEWQTGLDVSYTVRVPPLLYIKV